MHYSFCCFKREIWKGHMTDCRIYKPTKTAMQSGRVNTKKWVLEFKPTKNQRDRLMGWFGSGSTQNQVKLSFNTKEEAISFAKKNKLSAKIEDPAKRTLKQKNYSDNFSFRFRFD